MNVLPCMNFKILMLWFILICMGPTIQSSDANDHVPEGTSSATETSEENETTEYPNGNETTSECSSDCETTPESPSAGETTIENADGSEATPENPEESETVPENSEEGEATSENSDGGEATPENSKVGETTSETPEGGGTTLENTDEGGSMTTQESPEGEETTSDYPDGGETTPEGDDTSPISSGGGQTTLDSPDEGENAPVSSDEGETTPDSPDEGETTHDFPDGGDTTLETPSGEETSLEYPDGNETTPDGGETTPSGEETTSDEGETTPGGDETTSDGGEATQDGGEITPSGDETTPDGGETTPGGDETTLDGGEATQDRGETTSDGGETAPEEDETTTYRDKTTPDSGETSPGGDETTPGGDETTLDSGETSPDGDETTPNGGETTPDGGKIVPGGDETTPDGEETTHDRDETTPDGEETTIGENETTHDGRETTPDGGETTPNVLETTPDGGETTPDGGETTPDGGEATLDGGETSPDGGETTPDGGETTPVGVETSPGLEETTPDRGKTVPGGDETTSENPDESETTTENYVGDGTTSENTSTGEATSESTSEEETSPDYPEGEETTPESKTESEVTELPPVESECYPSCLNGGTCENRSCNCPKEYDGLTCEISYCDYIVPEIPGSKFISMEVENTGQLVCAEGYFEVSGSAIELSCVEGEWTPSISAIISAGFRCEPECQEKCLYGGKCSGADWCQCIPPYGGNFCSLSTEKECGGLPTVNNIVQIEDGENNALRFVKCLEGYFLEGGQDSFHYRCLEGEWTATDATRKILELGNLECLPVCEKNCENGGICEAPNKCKCVGEFKGPVCEIGPCTKQGPKTIPFGKIKYDTNPATITCNPGHYLRTGMREGNLACAGHNWYVEELEEMAVECIALEKCEYIISIAHTTITPATLAYIADMDCKAGYQFSDGSVEKKICCEHQVWHFNGVPLTPEHGCLPHCDPPCQNGGFCLEPNKCQCLRGTHGEQCEIKECDELLVYGKATKREIRSDEYEVSCPEDEYFFLGEPSLNCTCEDGIYKYPEGYEDTLILECFPKKDCSAKCQNGGTCHPGGSCMCTPEFTGEFCEEDVRCTDPLPAYENIKIKMVSTNKYLATCNVGYQLQNLHSEVHIYCRDGDQWHIEGYSSIENFSGCHPHCEDGCFNGGTCMSPGICACAVGFVGDNCESEVEVGCYSAPPAIKYATMEYNTVEGKYTCLEGYASPTGLTNMLLRCRRGSWFINECDCNDNPPDCEPQCVGSLTCLNGGICIGPGECQCIGGYSGRFCEIEEQMTCEEIPSAVYNGFTKITGSGPILTCDEGYEFRPSHKHELTGVCVEGLWQFPIGTASEINHNAITMIHICYPTCTIPCMYGGICIAPDSCYCIEPHTGPTCSMLITEQSSFCQHPPNRIANSFMDFSFSSTQITCMSGYALQSGGSRFDLTCENGEWILPTSKNGEFPQCFAVCEIGCLNGGICVRPNVCECAPGFYGDYCGMESKISICLAPPMAVEHGIIMLSYSSEQKAHIRCDSGYRLQSGYSEVDVECSKADNLWVTSNRERMRASDLTCEPVCESPCRNGGICIGPNICKCSIAYTGEWCQNLKCLAGPPEIQNSEFDFSTDGMSTVALCKPGYSFQNGETKINILCLNGEWILTGPSNSDRDLICLPTCTKPCFNGGWCIAPDLCKCTEGFYSIQCERRYMKTITGASCLFPYRYNDQWFYGCTGTDYHRPWCAIGINVQNLITSWAVCVADLGMKKVIATFEGDVCVFPFSYRRKMYNYCTTRDREKAWCATEVNDRNQVVSWGFCNHDWGTEVTILTVRGELCLSEYSWQETIYHGCVDDSQTPWCVTATSSTGIATKHGYCIADWGFRRVVITTVGSICVFPFRYRNDLHHSCFPGDQDEHLSRCAIKIDNDEKAIQFADCTSYYAYSYLEAPPLSSLFPMFGSVLQEIMTLNNMRCVLPFIYEGISYTGCTYGTSDQPWCATHVSEEGEIEETDICPPNWDIPEANFDEIRNINQKQMIQQYNEQTQIDDLALIEAAKLKQVEAKMHAERQLQEALQLQNEARKLAEAQYQTADRIKKTALIQQEEIMHEAKEIAEAAPIQVEIRIKEAEEIKKTAHMHAAARKEVANRIKELALIQEEKEVQEAIRIQEMAPMQAEQDIQEALQIQEEAQMQVNAQLEAADKIREAALIQEQAQLEAALKVKQAAEIQLAPRRKLLPIAPIRQLTPVTPMWQLAPIIPAPATINDRDSHELHHHYNEVSQEESQHVHGPPVIVNIRDKVSEDLGKERIYESISKISFRNIGNSVPNKLVVNEMTDSSEIGGMPMIEGGFPPRMMVKDKSKSKEIGGMTIMEEANPPRMIVNELSDERGTGGMTIMEERYPQKTIVNEMPDERRIGEMTVMKEVYPPKIIVNEMADGREIGEMTMMEEVYPPRMIVNEMSESRGIGGMAMVEEVYAPKIAVNEMSESRGIGGMAMVEEVYAPKITVNEMSDRREIGGMTMMEESYPPRIIGEGMRKYEEYKNVISHKNGRYQA